MDKKTIIKYALIAVGAYIILTNFFGCNKAEASELPVDKSWSFDAEVGTYEKRIDGGVYTTSDDADYVKASTDLGVIGGLGLTADVEYVDTDDYQLYTTIGTVLDTPFGSLNAGVLFSTIEGSDTVAEFNGSYDVTLPIINLDSVLDLAINEDSQYTIDLTTSKVIISDDLVNVIVGAAYGQSFDYDVDYTYTLGFAQIETTGDLKLFARVNYLDNDLYGDGYQETTDFGLSTRF